MRGSIIPDIRELRRQVRGKFGPNGRRLCLLCHREVPKGRRSWCSQDCVDCYLDDHDWNRLRRKVYRRDRGVCALCGTDCRALKAEFRRIRNQMDGWNTESEWLKQNGIPVARADSDFWDADHIRPVSEGGRNLLENLRTLCIPCHQKETHDLRQRLKKAKR